MVAGTAGAIALMLSLVLYLLMRHDGKASRLERTAKRRQDDFNEFDEALGEADAEDISRLFSGVDDREGGLRLHAEDGDNTGAQGDKGAA